MAKKITIKKQITRYIKLLSKEIPVERVILFGSYALGKTNKHSDIDLAVFSSAFSDKTHLKDVLFLWTEAHKVDSRIEPLPFSTSEITKVDPRSFLAEIIRNGKTIYKK